MRVWRLVLSATSVAALSIGLTACLETEYRVTEGDLVKQLGPRSVTYQRAETLVDEDRFDKDAPGATDRDREIDRAIRRQDLLGVERSKVEASLGWSLEVQQALRRLRGRIAKAAPMLRGLTLRVYPDDDYEIYGGPGFVKGWNRLVASEDRIVVILRRGANEILRSHDLRIRALRAGIDEFEQGGDVRFVEAARRWYRNDQRESGFNERYDRATGAWDRANDHLSEVADSDVLDAITKRYPESFFATSNYF